MPEIITYELPSFFKKYLTSEEAGEKVIPGLFLSHNKEKDTITVSLDETTLSSCCRPVVIRNALKTIELSLKHLGDNFDSIDEGSDEESDEESDDGDSIPSLVKQTSKWLKDYLLLDTDKDFKLRVTIHTLGWMLFWMAVLPTLPLGSFILLSFLISIIPGFVTAIIHNNHASAKEVATVEKDLISVTAYFEGVLDRASLDEELMDIECLGRTSLIAAEWDLNEWLLHRVGEDPILISAETELTEEELRGPISSSGLFLQVLSARRDNRQIEDPSPSPSPSPSLRSFHSP
jgi:hypothetical protein